MNTLHVLILGIVEGITEFLPISSTAHLLIAGKVLSLPETEFFKSFIIAIQSGAILAVVVLYTKRILKNKKLILHTIIAFVPTALIGLFLYPIIKGVLFENFTTIAWALILGGLAMLVLEKRNVAKTEDVLPESADSSLSYKKSFFIGVIQALAVIPGVSRSGATIIGGMLLGIPRTIIVEFSFVLAIPTLIAATGFDLLKTPPEVFISHIGTILFGIAISFIFALLAIRFFLRFISKHSFRAFAYYRILFGVVVLTFIL